MVGKDTTKIALTVVPASEPVGSESDAAFTVTVSTGNREELPEVDGVTVTIPSGLSSQFGSPSCLAAVAPAPGGRTGSCTFPAGLAPPPVGVYAPSAPYLGDNDLLPSGTATSIFTVTP